MQLERVGKRYGIRQPWIVREVSLDIPAGRLIRLEGRNGTGKSTLARVIAGVSAPSRGKVTGRPVTGYVPERFPPALPFSARDYLTHLGRVRGLHGAALAGRIDECLDRLGGLEFAGVPLRAMSKGMCQKIAVAQALLPRTGLLVLDEAWTGLDAAARDALDGAVAERLAQGGSVVFIDHDPRRLAGLGAENWQVAKGRLTLVPAAGADGGGPGGGGGGGGGVDGAGVDGAGADRGGGRWGWLGGARGRDRGVRVPGWRAGPGRSDGRAFRRAGL